MPNLGPSDVARQDASRDRQTAASGMAAGMKSSDTATLAALAAILAKLEEINVHLAAIEDNTTPVP